MDSDMIYAAIKQAAIMLPQIREHLSDDALIVIDLPADALKRRRDKREPKRLEKLRFEQQVVDLLMRRWRKQKARVKEMLNLYYPNRKSADDGWIDDDPENDAQIIAVLRNAAKRGIALFEDSVNLAIDYTMTDDRVAAWAREYAGELITKVDDTTKQSVRNAVARFAGTPGMTIGDVVNEIFDGNIFSEKRADMIATTEITRAYAQGQKEAGREMKEQFPDLKIIKTWFTNNDDRVCDICGPLEGKTSELDEEFEPGISEPPAHVNCRCWISTKTSLTDV